MSPVKPIQGGRDLVKVIAGVIVILAFVALAALAIAASRSDFSISAPGASRRAVAITPTGSDDLAVRSPAEQPATLPGGGFAPLPVAEAAPPTEEAVTPTTELPPPPPLTSAGTGKPCAALNLPAPQQVGGLQNLVRLIPLFGPFAPEAFAMLPAFQPGIDALGPLFPPFESMLDAGAPVLDAVTPVITQGEEAFFQAIAPLYAPARPAVLAAEKQLAAYLEPIVRQLATAPGSECLIALEALLASLQPGAQ